jgi:hypothetical protein
MTGDLTDFIVQGGGMPGSCTAKGLAMMMMALRKRCAPSLDDVFLDIGMGNGLPAVAARVMDLFPRTIGVEVGAGDSKSVVVLGQHYGVYTGLEVDDMHYSTILDDFELECGLRLFAFCFVAGWSAIDVANQLVPWLTRYRPIAVVLGLSAGTEAGRWAQQPFVGRSSGYVEVCRFAIRQVVSGREYTAVVFHRCGL